MKTAYLAAALTAAVLTAAALPLGAAAQNAPAQAELAIPPINLEQRMVLRCSAAFAVVADRQGRGEEWALAYPPMAERGMEFFIVSTDQVIEQAGLDEAQAEQLLRAEAEQLLDGELLAAIMPVCLRFLDQSGL